MFRSGTIIACLMLLAGSPGSAQESASYRLETVFNQGGSPQDGLSLTSTNFEVSLSSLGETLADSSLTGTGLLLDGGIVGSLRPAGELHGLRFDDPVTLAWNPDRSIGSYTVYRDALASLGGDVGCLADNLAATSHIDSDLPAQGTGFIYLVSALDRLHQEGPLGFDSAGSPRGGSPVCP